jgi:glycosyltransferase involved in cell wall biosynthesis
VNQSTIKTQESLVSVIINCYNGEKYVREAIESVIEQSYENWEIIFWDNQSTDRSADFFKTYTDARFKYFFAPKHTFLYEARNYAIEEAAGEFIAFLDVDDRWLPDKLSRQIALFSDPEIGYVCGNCWIESEKKTARWQSFKRIVPTGWVLNELLKDYFVGLLTLVVRRSALHTLKYICDPRFHLIGDFDLVIRLSINWKMDCIQEPIAISRLHDGNETGRHPVRSLDEIECWTKEARLVPAIQMSTNFEYFENKGTYMRAKQLILDGDRSGAYSVSKSLPWDQRRLKLWIAMLLPRFWVRRISR